LSDSDSSQDSSKEEVNVVENKEGNDNNSIEEVKTEAEETQIDLDDKIVAHVMVIGFHHHIGGQVSLLP
jgi:hypothetical protein